MSEQASILVINGPLAGTRVINFGMWAKVVDPTSDVSEDKHLLLQKHRVYATHLDARSLPRCYEFYAQEDLPLPPPMWTLIACVLGNEPFTHPVVDRPAAQYVPLR